MDINYLTKMSKYGTTAKVIGWCYGDNDYYEWGYNNCSIVVYTDLHEYYKIILRYCGYYEWSEMTLQIMDSQIGITHVPIKDYYIDLNLIQIYNYDYIFKSEVFEFSKGNEFKIYEEKFIEYCIEDFSDLIYFDEIIDNKKDYQEELLQVAFHPSRIEYKII
jgi:hypothetical protein